MAKKSDKVYEYEKGQRHASSGRWDPPHQGNSLTGKEDADDKKAYGEGYAHTTAQKDAASGEYNPPSDKGPREIYKDTWNAAKAEAKKNK